MSKLPVYAEDVIRELDFEDDETDEWTEREPYQRRALALWSSSREVLAQKALRRFGLLEHFAPRKAKWGGPRRKVDADPLDRSLDIIVDDVLRIRPKLQNIVRRQLKKGGVTAELVAAERHLRFVHGDIGEGETWEAERHKLVEKLHGRLKRGKKTRDAHPS